MISDLVAQAISDEITNDPQGIGYKGKTDAQIQVLLNSPVITQRTVTDVGPAPISRIMRGIAYGPNAVDVTDVTAAQKQTAVQGGL